MWNKESWRPRSFGDQGFLVINKINSLDVTERDRDTLRDKCFGL